MINLECSTKGDKRFSALYAKVNGHSIEDRYQLSKRFLYNKMIVRPENYKQAKYWQYKKEYKLLDFVVDGEIFSLEYLSAYYKFLWYLYLMDNKKLIEYARNFDTFTDCFKNINTINSQSDIIELIAKKGIEALHEECNIFIRKYSC